MKVYRYQILKILLVIVLVILSTGCNDKRISGEVKDIFNNPIEGVEVSIKNSAFIATTDENGKYNIDYVPGDIELLFKHKEYISSNLKINLSVKEDFPAKKISLYPNAKKTGMYYLDKEKEEITWLKSINEYSTIDSVPYIKSGKATFVLYLAEEKEYSNRDFFITDVLKAQQRAKKLKGSGWSALNVTFLSSDIDSARSYELKITKLDKHHMLLEAIFPDNKIFSWNIGVLMISSKNIGFYPTFYTTSNLEKIKKQRICSTISDNIESDEIFKYLKSVRDKESKFCTTVYGSKVSLYEYANLHNVSENIKELLPKKDVKNYSYESDEDIERIMFKALDKAEYKAEIIARILMSNKVSSEKKKELIQMLFQMLFQIHSEEKFAVIFKMFSQGVIFSIEEKKLFIKLLEQYQSNKMEKEQITILLYILYSNVYGDEKAKNFMMNQKIIPIEKFYKMKKESDMMFFKNEKKLSILLNNISSMNGGSRKKYLLKELMASEKVTKMTVEELNEILSILDKEDRLTCKLYVIDKYINANMSYELEEYIDEKLKEIPKDKYALLFFQKYIAPLVKLGKIKVVEEYISRNDEDVYVYDEGMDVLFEHYIKNKEFKKIDRIYNKYSKYSSYKKLDFIEIIYKKSLKYNEIDFAKKYYMKNKKSSFRKFLLLTYSLLSKDKKYIRTSFSAYFSFLRSDKKRYVAKLIHLIATIEEISKENEIDAEAKKEILEEIELILDKLEDKKALKENERIHQNIKGNNLVYDGKVAIKKASKDKKEVKKKSFIRTYSGKYGDIFVTAKHLKNRLVELEISMLNYSNYNRGWLSVSFPNIPSKSSVKSLEKMGFVRVNSYGNGSKIYNKNLKKSMKSNYLLVEGEGEKWQKYSLKSMKIVVEAQSENGDMVINIRGSFKPKAGKAVAFPSSDENGVVVGQQGYENYRIFVSNDSSNVSPKHIEFLSTEDKEKEKVDFVCVNMKRVANAFKFFKLDNGMYPETEEGFEALQSNPNPDKYTDYASTAYLEKIPKDSWGNKMVYIKTKNGFDIISYGADKREGGTDEYADIKYSRCKSRI